MRHFTVMNSQTYTDTGAHLPLGLSLTYR